MSRTIAALLEGVPALACAYCFGDPDDPASHGQRWAVAILGGATLLVLGAIAWTVRRWARRASAAPALIAALSLVLAGAPALAGEGGPAASTTTAAPGETPAAKRWRIRMDAFREENARLDPARRNAVFVGDSITEGFPLSRYFEGRAVLNRGIGADVTGARGPRGVVRRLEESVFACRPAALLLQIGINDLNGTSTPVPQVVSGVAAIVDAVRARMPDLPVVLCTVLPTAERWRSHAATNPRVEAFNEGLRALAAERRCALVDLHAAYRGDDGCLPAGLTKDGIHLVGDAYARWAEMVRPYVP